jgi:hypothetical protein
VASTNGTPGLAVEGQRVVGALDAQDDVVAGQVDLDRHLVAGHPGQQGLGVVLVGDVDAVADAAGAGDLDRLADVEAQLARGDQALGQLAGVQRQLHVRILAVQELQHPHVQGVVGQRSDRPRARRC